MFEKQIKTTKNQSEKQLKATEEHGKKLATFTALFEKDNLPFREQEKNFNLLRKKPMK